MATGLMRRNFAARAMRYHWASEDDDMSKRDWMHAIAYRAVFMLSAALLAQPFL
jgi:hypothetical protein